MDRSLGRSGQACQQGLSGPDRLLQQEIFRRLDAREPVRLRIRRRPSGRRARRETLAAYLLE